MLTFGIIRDWFWRPGVIFFAVDLMMYHLFQPPMWTASWTNGPRGLPAASPAATVAHPDVAWSRRWNRTMAAPAHCWRRLNSAGPWEAAGGNTSVSAIGTKVQAGQTQSVDTSIQTSWVLLRAHLLNMTSSGALTNQNANHSVKCTYQLMRIGSYL